MKRIKLYLLSAVAVLSVTSCFEDRDDNLISASEINDFVWKGMNVVYLYKADVPDLADDRFASNSEYTNYLNSFSAPEDIFESLIFERQTVDKFSVIVPNYFDLQNQQGGTTMSNGLEYLFYLVPGSQTEVFGVIRLVLNNSVADGLNLQRGQFFNAIDGVALNVDNFASLVSQETFTINFADYNDNSTPEVTDDTVTSNGQSVDVFEQVYTENPVHQVETFNINGQSIGYLVYNGFNSNFNQQLNAAFGQLQASNVQHLVLDLRYNPGGSVLTASYLGSMITGQFNGEVFSKLFYNENLQQNNTNFNFSNSIEGVGAINSLNLNKVYVLTTSRSASASELVINSLKPYIDVVQIGDNTTGKTQASITIYDSPNFAFQDVNPNHTYAMQPLVANSTNRDDLAVPSNGLTPNISLIESPANFGTLGDVNEPLLAAAIADILGTGRLLYPTAQHNEVKNTKEFLPFEDQMYIDSTLDINIAEQ